MNKFLIGALALTATSATGIASESDWAGLDAELDSLSTSLAAQGDGPNLSGWIITSLRFSSDINVTNPADGSDNDLGGFNLDSVRLNVDGSVGEYSYFVSAEFGDADRQTYEVASLGTPLVSIERNAVLLDAYVDWMIGDTVHLKMGNFRQPFSRSGLITRNRTLFVDRTSIGNIFAGRQTGVMAHGDFEQVRWHVAAQNGLDSIGDDFLLTGRVDVDVIGSGVGDQEGAYGAGDETALTVGAAVADEAALDDGLMWTIDAALTSGPFYAQAEIADFDDGTGAGGAFGRTWGTVAFLNSLGATGSDVADTTPWAATASYCFPDNDFEVAARWEDSDNDNNDEALSLGINKYVRGHDIKWQLSYTMFNTDVTDGDADILSLALAMGF